MKRNKPHRGKRRSTALEVLYEDAAILAVNKPAGLVSVPIRGSDAPSALVILNRMLESRKQKAMIVHRIDRYTSGILLFAKTQHDRKKLIEAFLAHTPSREYLAVVRGIPEKREGTLVHYLRKTGFHQTVSSKRDPRATRAELHYHVEKSSHNAALVSITLVTGLQNQIRAQFAAIGNPLIGDRKYVPSEASETRIDRVALHAFRLEITHPRTGKKIPLECPLPQDFSALLRGLDRKTAKEAHRKKARM